MKLNKFIKTFTISLIIAMTLSCCSVNSNEYDSEINQAEGTNDTVNTKDAAEFRFMNSNVNIPFKLKDLKQIKIDEETAFETDEGDLFCSVWFDDNYRIGTLKLENCSVDDENKEEKNVVYLKISPDFMFEDFEFEYMGLTFNSTKEEIIDTLGESEVENELTYTVNDKTKINFKITDNTIYRVTISNYDFDE